MSSRLTLEEVFFQVFDDDFELSKDESSDEEGEGIHSYLGERSLDPEAIVSIGRLVVLNLPSGASSASF